MKNTTLAHVLIDFVNYAADEICYIADKISYIEKYEHILREFFYHAKDIEFYFASESKAK